VRLLRVAYRASVTLAVAGALAACGSARAAVPPAGSSTAAAPAGTPLPVPSADPDDGAGPPTRLRIPAIGVDSPLELLHLDAQGALRAPSFPHAGWYADGPAPGDVGPAVIAGHVDSTTGPAVFYRLGQLRPGDPVQVRRGDRWLTFRVVEVRRYPKNAFPTAAVYGPTPDPQLRLITCSGAFDTTRHSYVDNTVVYAVVT
jgi:LPXTG-site transpeptidase (sortase) family protein